LFFTGIRSYNGFVFPTKYSLFRSDFLLRVYFSSFLQWQLDQYDKHTVWVLRPLKILCLLNCVVFTSFSNYSFLVQLGISGNVRITHQGLLDNLRSFNVEPNIGLKKLRIANLATLSKVQYDELLSLLKIDEGLALHKQEPRIFHADCFSSDHHGGHAADGFLPDLHDGYALDIERCPICENYKLVYDCPAEGCNDSGSSKCRGCLVCIQRCLRCGRCINNEYEETFSLDNLCRGCQVNGDVAGK
jgi:hypothetical protein